MHSAVFAVVAVSVCLFVRLSAVTSVYCIEMAELTIKLFSSLGGPIILVFPQETRLWNSDGITPNRGAKLVPIVSHVNKNIIHSFIHTKHLRFFNQYLIVSRKRCEMGPYSYYRTLIGNHRCSIEPCHSLWPLNVTFKGRFGNPLYNFWYLSISLDDWKERMKQRTFGRHSLWQVLVYPKLYIRSVARARYLYMKDV